jgi:hypothetical protein
MNGKVWPGWPERPSIGCEKGWLAFFTKADIDDAGVRRHAPPHGPHEKAKRSINFSVKAVTLMVAET